MSKTYDVVIVGAGIAGASLAYWLGELGITRVAVVDREPVPGYHASGRSAATYLSFSTEPWQRRVVAAAGAFFRDPPPGFAGLFDPTGILLVFDEPEWAEARASAVALADLGHSAEILSPEDIVRHLPGPAAHPPAHERAPDSPISNLGGAIHLPRDGRLHVPGLLAAYLDHAHRRGAELRYRAEVVAVLSQSGVCTGVDLGSERLHAGWVVNAAGAWAGHIARLAGAASIPLRPCRRTVITFDAPGGADVTRWPLVAYESRKIYFAPERTPDFHAPCTRLLACPMDEDPLEPCDAAPDPSVVATARARLAAVAPGLAPAALVASRAGLRTFAPDRQLVLGEDPGLRGFFWLAGQGGWGIESSPAIGKMAAELIVRDETSFAGLAELSPSRFSAA